MPDPVGPQFDCDHPRDEWTVVCTTCAALITDASPAIGPQSDSQQLELTPPLRARCNAGPTCPNYAGHHPIGDHGWYHRRRQGCPDA